ncbi:OmpA family protein [Spirosoma arcticum]
MTPVRAQPGLKGEYYNGTNFERKVLTRVDPKLSFTWVDRSPAPGIDRSYYSVRWTGKLLAPASGRYTFYAKVDDGIRIWVGNKTVMDVWQLNDSKKYTGSVVLQAGRSYDLKVEFFNAMYGGVIELFWERPDAKKPLFSFSDTPGTPVTAQFFRQPDPPATQLPKPVVRSPRAVVVAGPKPVTEPVAPPSKTATKAAVIPPVAVSAVTVTKPNAVTVVAPQPVTGPLDGLVTGETVALRQVQFAQSSYVLLPGSSAELDQLVQVMNRNPQWRIEVAGHTDNVGDARLNLALSENRAKVVAHYLTRRGIAEERINAKGYGSTHPVADNAAEEGRVKNRRVEITVR